MTPETPADKLSRVGSGEPIDVPGRDPADATSRALSLDAPDAIELFIGGLERALRDVQADVADLAAERDGLRARVDTLQARLAAAEAELASRESITESVRRLEATVDRVVARSIAAVREAPAIAQASIASPPAPPRPPGGEPSALERLAALGVWPPRGQAGAPGPTAAPPRAEPAPPPEPPRLAWDPEQAPAIRAGFYDQPSDEPEAAARRPVAARIGYLVLVLLLVTALVVTVVTA